MELQHFSHKHPLVFIEKQNHESEKAYCSGCGELVSGSSFRCVECRYYLDKLCAEAPSEINHPFHCNHSLKLQVSPPFRNICDFCDKGLDKFVYHCSCDLNLHIKCALLSKSIAEKGFGKLDYIPHKEALVSIENFSEELKGAKCFACWQRLLDFAYLDLGHGIFLHKKCVDLPTEINHFLHSQHSLILQFNSKPLPCQMCKKTQLKGFVYRCSPCEVALHITCAELPTKINHLCHRNHPLFLKFDPESLPCQICQNTQDEGLVYCCSICKFKLHVDCASPPPIIKGEIHEHPFTLFWKQLPFICDACGTTGNCASYTCYKCSLTIHGNCISLPPIIKFPRHRHPLSHTFILGQYEMKTLICEACPEKVNAQHGVYCCSDCNYVVHADCAQEYSWFSFDELEDMDEDLNEKSAFAVIKVSKLGEDIVIASEIKHLNHQHNLVLSDDYEGYKVCDGCMLSISTLFYYCSQCEFFLHKSCAEAPKKKYLWFHRHQSPLTLTSNHIFRCPRCFYWFNASFAYKCNICESYRCLACALTSDTPTFQGHKHRLYRYDKYEGQCNGCGDQLHGAYVCKECKFAVHNRCLRLPSKILHEYDEHPLILTYHEDNLYSEYTYCDICEETRNPNHWFYHCAICSTSAHRECVVKRHSYMKLGGSYRMRSHPHQLTFTKKISACHVCHQPCLDLSLECLKSGCDYIVHLECITWQIFNYSFIQREDEGTS
ncbi:hypothetical protein Gotur_017504 [Gossypium turneri]